MAKHRKRQRPVDTKLVTVRIPWDLAVNIEDLAKRRKITKSELIRQSMAHTLAIAMLDGHRPLVSVPNEEEVWDDDDVPISLDDWDDIPISLDD